MVADPFNYSNLPSSIFDNLPSSDFNHLPQSIFEHLTVFSHPATPTADSSKSTETPHHQTQSPSSSRHRSSSLSDSRNSHATPSRTSPVTGTASSSTSSTSAALQTAGPVSNSHDGGLPKGAVAAIAVICALVGLGVIALFVIFWRKRRRNQSKGSYADFGANRPESPTKPETTQFRRSIDALSSDEPTSAVSDPQWSGNAHSASFGPQPPSPIEDDPFLSPAERAFAHRADGYPESNITPSQHLDLALLPLAPVGANRVYHNPTPPRQAPPRPPPMAQRGRQNIPFQPRSPATAKPLGTINESGGNPNSYPNPNLRPRAASFENDGYAAARAAMRPTVPPSAVGRDGSRYTPIPYTPPRRSSRQGMNGNLGGGLPVIPGRYQPSHHYPGISETVMDGSNGAYPENRWSDGSRYSVTRKPVGGRVSPPF